MDKIQEVDVKRRRVCVGGGGLCFFEQSELAWIYIQYMAPCVITYLYFVLKQAMTHLLLLSFLVGYFVAVLVSIVLLA